ncbi:g-type lysozyme inhibitor [Lysobacter soli]|uniref:g-type lysozyme inhibitor n=1 Tax=Lysobacter soli TaxID=453783 RepID=UPI0018DD9497|nr:g-type lysozyme inhibitor [Lysobacter soli]
MKPVHTLALSIAFAFGATLAVAADKVTTVPVKFAKGASSATMKGSFAGYDSVHYTLDARAGQTMTVTLAGSSNANFNVFAPGDAPGTATALGSNADRGWTGKLPKTGTYTVQVYQMRASARRGEKVPYTITLSIR